MKTFAFSILFFLDSLPAFPLRAMGADDICILDFISLSLGWM